MRTKILFLILIISYLGSITSKAQEITCDAFCITDVYMDTSVSNLMYVTLFFSGADNDFINYPWIAEVINEQGDTVGVGTWNFFGQIGNSSNDYPVTVDFDAVPDNFNATMVFHYDDTLCVLSFPCIANGIENQNKNQQVSIFPNPFSTETKVQSETPFHDLTIKMFDLQGRVVKQIEHLSGSEILLRRDGLLEGVYFVQLVEGRKIMGMWRVVVGE